MSKTITLETAQALKSAFDAAGIEMPETDAHIYQIVNRAGEFHYKIMSNAEYLVHEEHEICNAFRKERAPDAEELGEWLPSLFAGNRLTIQKKFGRFNSGYYRPGIMMHSKLDRPNLAESLAALMIACLKADPDQIKKHLAQ